MWNMVVPKGPHQQHAYCRKHSYNDLMLIPSCSSEQDSKLLRRGGIKMKPSVKDSMVLIQENMEDQASLTGAGGSGGRGGRRGMTLQRRAGSSVMHNPFSKQQRQLTARIVIMGTDRVLGRLAKAYYFFRWGTTHITQWIQFLMTMHWPILLWRF